MVSEEQFLDSSPLSKKELYDLGVEHGVEGFIKELKKEFYKVSKPFDEEYGLFVSEKRFNEIIREITKDGFALCTDSAVEEEND